MGKQSRCEWQASINKRHAHETRCIPHSATWGSETHQCITSPYGLSLDLKLKAPLILHPKSVKYLMYSSLLVYPHSSRIVQIRNNHANYTRTCVTCLERRSYAHSNLVCKAACAHPSYMCIQLGKIVIAIIILEKLRSHLPFAAPSTS
jgi:hypothetical protein